VPADECLHLCSCIGGTVVIWCRTWFSEKDLKSDKKAITLRKANRSARISLSILSRSLIFGVSSVFSTCKVLLKLEKNRLSLISRVLEQLLVGQMVT
jgi:hypothetical protein